MNTILWGAQWITAFIFMYSGINKSIFSEQKLVAKGQTGVEGLPLPLIRFIGVSEIFGAVGLIVPWWINILPILTPIAAICFAVMMILAARIHYKRKEYKNVLTNTVIFLLCLFITYGRLFLD
ncbi:MAG TPA: DoxX family protein [Chitinophagaceae bacterium]|nr:DoxX family protein [Chitinophagaceae bacterium]